MITHVVIFSWVEEVTPAEVDRVRTGLSALATELSGIATINHGSDLEFRDGNGDYGLVATFADRQAWDAYQAHPSHKAFVRDCVLPIQASRRTIQFQGTPAL